MVERSLRGLRDGWTIDSIVDVRETGRRATVHTREYRVRWQGFEDDEREVTWQRSADILSTGADGRPVAGPERRRRVDMMRTAEQCHDGTPHAGRSPCVLPHGTQATIRKAAGAAAWAAMLRASAGDLEDNTEALPGGCTRH